jgi:SEC-C motif
VSETSHTPSDETPTTETAAGEAGPAVPDTVTEMVDRLLAVEWPEAELIESILARGSEAVEPLREVIRGDPKPVGGWGFVLAENMLGSLGDPAAIPDLLRLFRCDDDAVIDWLHDTVGSFGPQVLEPLLEIVRDSTLKWYPREMALEAAKAIAAADPALQARVAEVARPLLAGYLERHRAGEELADDEFEMASLLVCDLADLVDPQGLDFVRAAFEAGLIDTSIVDLKSVERSYRGGKPRLRPANPHAWLDTYKGRLQSHLEFLRRPPEPPRTPWTPPTPSSREKEKARATLDSITPMRPVEPIRKTVPRPGRNDPCWCGSGKKYKKCHMSEDQA